MREAKQLENQYGEYIDKIELLLRKACFNIKKKGREILQDFEITPPQFDALQALIFEGEMTISELSTKLYLAPSTITDLIDRMEKSSLVKRARDTKDRRTVKVQAEDKGLKLVDEVIARRCSYVAVLMEEMSEIDRKQFINYLEILNK
jgi:DNA-binding MarR family transcriptional regulator